MVGPTVQVGTEAEGSGLHCGDRAQVRWLPPLPSSARSVFGHISFRSDWELVKVDFRPSFSRPCSEEDYSSWDLANLQVGGCRGWALAGQVQVGGHRGASAGGRAQEAGGGIPTHPLCLPESPSCEATRPPLL